MTNWIRENPAYKDASGWCKMFLKQFDDLEFKEKFLLNVLIDLEPTLSCYSTVPGKEDYFRISNTLLQNAIGGGEKDFSSGIIRRTLEKLQEKEYLQIEYVKDMSRGNARFVKLNKERILRKVNTDFDEYVKYYKWDTLPRY